MVKSNNTNYFLHKTMNEILEKSFTLKIFFMNGETVADVLNLWLSQQ
jgi:hypothetical protein